MTLPKSSRFAGSLSPVVSLQLEAFVRLLEQLYGVTLPAIRFEGDNHVRKFCEGLTIGDASHPWQPVVRRLSARCRFGFAHSLFLFRKVIPKEKPSVNAYVRKLAETQAPPDEKFLDYARKLTRKLFQPGWDRSYVRHAVTSSLPMTSCSESGREAGGSRLWRSIEREERSEFCSYVMDSVAPKYRGVSRVQAILTGGKWRIISIPPRVDNALRPLHKALYSHLSHFQWLLRGDAKARRFKDFVPKAGEIFVSGDYESATDNLNSGLQIAVMEELLSVSSSVPSGIKEHALSTYHSLLKCDEGTFVQRRGQLMGQLTSFPLLCLINYITFRYSIRRPVPVRINGDDIVFRATPEECSLWERNVAKGGLTLSSGKTLKDRRFFTLNSKPFQASAGGARDVGFVRSSALFKTGKLSETIPSLNGRFYSACSGYGRQRKAAVRKSFVDLNSKPIWASQRSLTRGLGLAVDRSLLHDLGMWHRELFYLEQVNEPVVPSVTRGELPSGWVQVSRNWIPSDDLKYHQEAWGWACCEHAWFSDFSPSDFSERSKMDHILEGCSPYGLGTLATAKVRRLLGLSRRQLWRWIYKRQNESLFGRTRWSKSETVFVEVDRCPRGPPVVFVKGGYE